MPEERSGTFRGSGRRAVRWPELLAGAVLLALWWLTLAPTVLGGPVTYVVVRGDSMQPTFEAGDLVLVRAEDAYAVGDVLAYRVPDGEIGADHVVIHRAVDGDSIGGFVLLGDHNPVPDPWRPRAADIVGAAWVRLPFVGRVVETLRQPAALAALAAAAVVWIVVMRWPASAARRATRSTPVPVARQHYETTEERRPMFGTNGASK